MSQTIIGIDLGTTNSCVAIKGGCEKCFKPNKLKSYSIVTDRLQRKFTPSVLSFKGNSGKPYEVGHKAKKDLSGKYPPVMFAKRHLGTDKKFQVDDEKFLSPEEVSAEILKYLKEMAETKLGVEIKKAVVTVPAYFSMSQKMLTRDALKMAGFAIDDDRYIIQEPVAAAFTYMQMTQSESLKIMVYDLGGGTFDITILQKDGDQLEVVKFGGDHALGGYDFDKLIADHLVEQLKEVGYQLDLDPEKNLGDKIIYTKLLLEAEAAKIVLSKDLECTIRNPGVFNDHNGEVVDLDLTLDRPTYEDLISKKVQYTMDLCRETLDGSDLSLDKIDNIIMVGGSSYTPMIQERFETEFGRKPELVEPDLCIAIGAAIHASTLQGIGIRLQHVILEFDSLPTVSSEPTEALFGKVSSISGEPLGEGYAMEVSNQMGTFKENSLLEDKQAFYFDVPLQANTENVFSIKVTKNDREIDETQIRITNSDESDAYEAGDTKEVGIEGAINVPRTIYVKRKKGLEELAREGEFLPFENTVKIPIFKKGSVSDTELLTLEIPLLEGDFPIGGVDVTEIPGNIEDGAEVEIEIKISRDFQIIVGAYIPSVDREGKSVFSLNKVQVKSADDLRNDLENLELKWMELKLMLSQEELARVGVRVDKAFKRAKGCLEGIEPDTTEASNIVVGIDHMLKDLEPVILKPTKEQFRKLWAETDQLISRAEKQDQGFAEKQMGKTLKVIVKQANAAYERQDQETWETANNQIEEMARFANNILKGGGDGGGPQITWQQVYGFVVQEITKLESAIEGKKNHPEYWNWQNTINEMKADVEGVSRISSDDGKLNELIRIYQQKIQPLNDKMGSSAGSIGI